MSKSLEHSLGTLPVNHFREEQLVLGADDRARVYVFPSQEVAPEASSDEIDEVALYNEQIATANFADITATLVTGGVGAQIHQRHEKIQVGEAPLEVAEISEGADLDRANADLLANILAA